MVDYQNLWNRRAEFFDVDYSNYDKDIDFFKNFTNPNKEICELGCGTLRIARLLNGHYRTFYGVDLSENMLHKGCDLLPNNLKGKVETIHSGMQDFSLPTNVDLVFNMGNSFLMLTEENKRNALQCVQDVLTENGKFILEIYNPNEWRKKPEEQILHLRTISNDTTHVTLNYTQAINEKESYNKIIWFREEVDKETREVSKDVFPIKFHFLEYIEAKTLLENYFKITDIYGSFEMDQFDKSTSKRMIFICE